MDDLEEDRAFDASRPINCLSELKGADLKDLLAKQAELEAKGDQEGRLEFRVLTNWTSEHGEFSQKMFGAIPFPQEGDRLVQWLTARATMKMELEPWVKSLAKWTDEGWKKEMVARYPYSYKGQGKVWVLRPSALTPPHPAPLHLLH